MEDPGYKLNERVKVLGFANEVFEITGKMSYSYYDYGDSDEGILYTLRSIKHGYTLTVTDPQYMKKLFDKRTPDEIKFDENPIDSLLDKYNDYIGLAEFLGDKTYTKKAEEVLTYLKTLAGKSQKST